VGIVEDYTREGIVDNLGTRVIGRHTRWHETLPSTNELAMRLAEIQVPEGTVVVAEEQTAGRGRFGRAWASPRGGIWFSVILRPRLPVAQLPLVGLVAGAAVARAVRTSTRLPARLKWPNDVLVEGRKVAGILAEAGPRAEWLVLGIGINANVPLAELPQDYPATSLTERAGAPVDRGQLAREVLRELDRAYDELQEPGGSVGALRKWREMADTLGRTVRVDGAADSFEGLAVDVDDAGALLVRLADGRVERVVAGEVTLRGLE